MPGGERRGRDEQHDRPDRVAEHAVVVERGERADPDQDADRLRAVDRGGHGADHPADAARGTGDQGGNR
jgi:hypothetical protein